MVFLTQLIVKGGSLHPTEMARLMWISKHSMSKIIDKLEKDGLVIRHRVDKDRRAVRIRVTLAGLDFILKTLSTHDILWQEIISSLSENEREDLIGLMREMVHAFPQDVINAHLK
jgi:DNA-binding MarR family transcriptional regulator